ncbi:MAG: transcription-repair coupling factor [Rickettsiales bacterium]|nr:transcription-repair coupling factor [Rickettsiales bacterium]
MAEPQQQTSIQLLSVTGVTEGAQLLAIRHIAQTSGHPVIYVTHSDRELRRTVEAAALFLPEFHVLAFPAWDCLPYDRAAPHPSIMAERVATLTTLANSQPKGRTLIVTTASAFLQRLPPVSSFANARITLTKGTTLPIEKLSFLLQDFGYRRAGKVMEPGEFAVRGSILDVFASATGDRALRVDFFGEEIESIRWFDPLTQRSTDDVSEYTLAPVSEVRLTENAIATFRERYLKNFGVASKDDTLYASISNHQYMPGMEHWMPLFFERCDSLLDYAPQAVIALAHNAWHTLEERQELIHEYYQARKDSAALKQKQAVYHPVAPDEMFLMGVTLEVKLERKSLYHLTPFSSQNHALELHTQPVRMLHSLAKQQQLSPFALLAVEAYEQKKLGRSLVICAATEGSLARLAQLLEEHGANAQPITAWAQAEQTAGLYLAISPLENGFTTPKVTCYTEQDILGHRVIQTKKRKRNADAFLQEAASFEPGELLVHKDHGIGRFDGLVTMEAGGKRHDCLKLLYRDDDKLFLPVENMDLIARYGEDSAGTELDKLGASNWQQRKAKMKERIRMAADELMKIAAERALRPGHRLPAAPGSYEEFCARFPYDETEDQQRSIDEVETDLVSGKPMDRLICGDVGFGKTEVAMRAAFIAASAPIKPVQVAIIAPTTLLARQHFRSFRARFDDTGLEIRMLSRLTTAKDAKATREGLKNGSVDVVIGTHAILSKQVDFARLGLMIIDEEQHFGVKQKEALKQMRANIHVLTLSATPIPRTLQLALAGVRELSLITTPPVDRLAVRSFVLPYDAVVIKEAIQREIHRGGQVFYVTPRVADIAELKFKIMELVPQARLAIAHGQLPASELDRIMNDFYDGKFDVLLSTSIVESGIDVPTANTLIVNRADMFGLSQLYQLRGRVGRSKVRAYAYFTMQHHKRLSDQAQRRLEVMQTLDTLGAGFTLASHDMEIRGFGNLVGEEQSGHIKEVGVELYQQMLSEAVAAARAASLPDAAPVESDDWSPQINLGVSILIPEDYISDLTLRLSLYRRLSSLQTEADIESFAAEMADRFGPLPHEVQTLLEVMRIKQHCRAAHIARIDTGPKGAVLSFHQNTFPKPEALIGYIAKHSHRIKLRSDQKLVFTTSWNTEKEKLRGVHELLKQIGALAL